MCTVAGMMFGQNTPYTMSDIKFDRIIANFTQMLVLGQDRGIDSTGVVAIYSSGAIDMLRLNMRASEFVKTSEYIAFMNELDREHLVQLIANNRAQPIPEGDSSSEDNRQPIRFKSWIGSHNGTISNDKDIVAQYGLETYTQVDSEVMLHLMEYISDGETPPEEVIQSACSEISGGIAFAIADMHTPERLFLVRNFKPMTIAYDRVSNCFIYNSEKKNIELAYGVETLTGGLRYMELPVYTAMILDANTCDYKLVPIQTKITASLPECDEGRALVICSGGMDSCTAATVARKLHGKEVTLLHFNYGQMAYESEHRAILATAEAIGATSEEIDMSWLGQLTTSPLVDKNTELPQGIDSAESTKCWVPARNLLLLSVAAAYAEAKGYKYIYSGFNLEEGGSYPDNVVPFFRAMNQVFNYGTLTRVQLVLALERLMKPEIIKLGTHLGTPLDKTWSCDEGEDEPCGTCGCCFTRQMAYVKAGLPDPQTYRGEPEKPVWLQEGKFTPNDVSIEEILNKVTKMQTF